MADIKNQDALDALFKLAVEDKNKDAIKKLKKLLLDGEAHIPKGSTRPVFGAAPKVEEAAAAVEKLSAGRAAKKEMTAAMQAEMAAAEERAKKAAAAQKAADQKALEELQAQRAADEAKKAAAAPAPEEPKASKAEEPKAPTAKKNEPTKETKAPKSRTGKGTEGLKQVRTREVAVEAAPSPAARTPAPGVEVANPARQEMQEKMGRIKAGAKVQTERAQRANPIGLPDIRRNIAEGNPKAAIEKLRGHDFKKAFARLANGPRVKLLQDTFGPNVIRLTAVQQARLGEMAMARGVMQSLGLTETPDFGDVDRAINNLADRIQNSDAKTLNKGSINNQIDAAHKATLTSGGKIRAGNLSVMSEERGEKLEQLSRNKRDAEAAAKKEARDMARPKSEPKPKKVKTAPKKDVPDLDFGTPTAPATVPAAAPTSTSAPARPTVTVPELEEFVPPTGSAAPAASASPAAPAAVGGPARTASTKLGKTGAKEIRETLAANSIDEKRVLNAINNAMAGQKGFKPFTKLEDVPAALRPRVDAYLTKVIAAGGRAMPLPPASATASAAASGGTIADVLGGTSGVKAPPPTGISKKEAMDLRRSLGRISPEAEAGLVKAAAGKGIPITRLEDLPKSELSWAKRWLAGTKRPVPYGPKLPPGGVKPPVFGPELPPGGLKPAAELVEFGPATAAKEAEMAAAAAKGGGLRALGGKALGFLGPLFALYSAYSLMDMAKQGTVDEADQRRMRALQTFGALSGGLAEEANARNQIQQMRQMVDLAGLERQRSLDEMRQQYTGNSALDALLRGQQGSLAAIAAPSRPSIAEMMARM